MSLRRTVVAFVLAAIVLGSFAALIYQQKNFASSVTEQSPCIVQVYSSIPGLRSIQPDNFCLLAVPAPATTFSGAGQPAINNSTRADIYAYIKDNPGVQFRGICGGLGISVGLAQYHLGVLVKSGLVSYVRDGRYKRFFASKRFSRKEMLMISLLRHRTARKIFEVLLHKKRLSHGELAGEVSVTSQALTWQMKHLGETELIMQTSEGLRTIYSLEENSASLLTQYLALVVEKP